MTIRSMPRWQRLTLSSCAAIVAYMLAYVGVDYAKLPRVTHFQLEHTLRIGVYQGLPSGYLGYWLFALAAAVVVGGGAHALLGLRRTPAPERTVGLALAWAITATLLAVGYYTWNNWP